MILDDTATLANVIQNCRVDFEFHADRDDTEVDRLFKSSPPLVERVLGYEIESFITQRESTLIEVRLTENINGFILMIFSTQ